MVTAGLMLAHPVAAQAFRDTTFLTAWPATGLTLVAPGAVLIMLAALHLLCAGGVTMLRRAPPLLSPEKESVQPGTSGLRETFRTPYLRTIAAFVILTSASSAILDFLLKSQARATFGTGPDLLRFFTVFYGSVQVLSFLAQTRAERVVRRLGMAGNINP